MSRTAELRRWIVSYRDCIAKAASNSNDVSYYEQEIAGFEDTILRFERYRVIAELCIRKKLPAGDPCWMGELICSFIVPLIEEEDTSRHCRLRCCCPEEYGAE